MSFIAKTCLTVIGLFTYLAPSVCLAELYEIKPNATTPFEMKVSQLHSDSITVEFSLHHFEFKNISTLNKQFSEIRLEGASLTDIRGLPSLPRISKDLAIPYSSTASIRLIDQKIKNIAMLPPLPSRGEISRCTPFDETTYEINESYYSGQKFYVEPAFSLSLPFLFRNVKGVKLQLRPFSYNIKTRELIVTESMTLEIKLNRTYGDNRMIKGQNNNESFQNLYREHFSNFKQSIESRSNRATYADVKDQGELLIISHDKFIGQMAPFVEWKRKMGFRTHLNNLRDIGDTYEDIKKFIKNFYTENPALTFVLFVGDAEFIPFHEGKSGNANGNEADPMYGLIEGNDSYPEVIIGRFPAKNASDVSNMIYRSINYEKNPASGDWYRKAIGIASDEGSPTDGERANALREILMESRYTTVEKLYDPGVRASDITASLNDGRGLVNYLGHGNETSWGTGDFNNSDIKELKNTGKLPVIVDVACLNGRFGAKTDSFAEVWLKAGTPEAPTGAIAIFASSTEQDWVPPTVGQKAIASFISKGTYRTVGSLFTNGAIAVLEDDASTAEQTFETWHIFGDPTLKIKTH